MAVKTQKVVVNGKEMEMSFPVSALMRLEDKYGITVGDLGDKKNSQSLSFIVKFLWAGLSTKQPELTLEELTEDLDVSELQELAKPIGELLGGSKNSQK